MKSYVLFKFCSKKLGDEALMQLSTSVFINKKSVVSFAKYLPKPVWPLSFPNCYLNQNVAKDFRIKSLNDQTQDNNAIKKSGIFRILISPQIGSDNIITDINTLKNNDVLKQIFALQSHEKYKTIISNVIIDDKIEPSLQQKAKIEQYIKNVQKNMLELEKMIQNGLQLNYAYMISKQNYACKEWVKILNKKRKAINSDIVLGKQKNKFQEIVYDQGYKLEHVFLTGYKQQQQQIIECQKLSETTSYNLQQLINILPIIDFNGKIILPDTPFFQENLIYLQDLMKKIGYSSKDSSVEDNWMARV